jgi:hypothetical protein
MFEPKSADTNQVKHRSGGAESNGDSEVASAPWKGAAGETSSHSLGRVATTFGAGGVLGFGVRTLLPEVKTPQTAALAGLALTGVAGYAMLRHGAEWFHDAKVLAAPQYYSKKDHELAENSVQHTGSRAADLVVFGIGLATGRAVGERLPGSSSAVTESSTLPKVNLFEALGVRAPVSEFAMPAAKAELPMAGAKVEVPLAASKAGVPLSAVKMELPVSLADAEVPASIAKKEIESPHVPVKFVEPRPSPPGSKEHAVRTLISQATNMSFVSKMERGTNGAYLIKDKDGIDHIFKLVSPKDVTPQIFSSARASAAVDSLAARTPTYEEVKFTPGHGTWYMQELLPGTPAPVPSDRLIGQMVKLNDRQAEKAIAGSEDWNQKVIAALHDDAQGWKKRISQFNPEGADLVKRVESFVAGASHDLRTGDIVHGDFQHYNALVSSSDRLTGYVDWEGSGVGDRSIDVSRLLYDSYVAEKEANYRANPETLRMLAGKINEISGPSAVRSNMGYWILQVADFGAKMGAKDLSKFASVGRRIISDLDTKQFSLAS